VAWVPPDDSPEVRAERARRVPLDERRPVLLMTLWGAPLLIGGVVVAALNGQWASIPVVIVLVPVMSWSVVMRFRWDRRYWERRARRREERRRRARRP